MQNSLHAVQNGSTSSVVTISQITPIQNCLAYSKVGDSVKQNNRDIMELKPAVVTSDQVANRLKVNNTARSKPAGTARGWMKLKNNMAAPGSPPENERKEGLNNVAKAVFHGAHFTRSKSSDRKCWGGWNIKEEFAPQNGLLG